MYINRKDGTLVEAEKYYSIGLKIDGWIVKTDNNTLYIPAKDFQEQYGEAMICPLRKDCPIECIRKQPHPKSSLCSVQGCCGTSCVSYIPEHKKSGRKENKMDKQEEHKWVYDYSGNIRHCDICGLYQKAIVIAEWEDVGFIRLK